MRWLWILFLVPSASWALDVCQDGPRAIEGFARARDAGTPYATVVAPLDIKPGDPEWQQKDFYKQMADWVYLRLPLKSPGDIEFQLFRNCFGRPPTNPSAPNY